MAAPTMPTFRDANRSDLPAIIALMVDDDLRRSHDSTDPADLPTYEQAFAVIGADPNHAIVVGEVDGHVVATLLLSFLPGIARKGMWRGHVENVRVASSVRGQGIGTHLMHHAIERCREKGCKLVQLTTDKRRADARRFYERLGFDATHEGMKRNLTIESA